MATKKTKKTEQVAKADPSPADVLVIPDLPEAPVRPLPTPGEIIAHDYPRVFLREPVDIYLAILNELVLARIWREHGRG